MMPEPALKNFPFATMAIEYVVTALLQTYPRQVRRHAQSKIRRLAKFIEKSGVIVPLVVDKDNFVILGNARLQALRLLGVESIPVIRVTHLDETMIRALILADNQFTLNADWYKEALREELLHEIELQLSQATMDHDSRGKLKVDKKPDGARSPNLADAIIMCYLPARKFAKGEGYLEYMEKEVARMKAEDQNSTRPDPRHDSGFSTYRGGPWDK